MKKLFRFLLLTVLAVAGALQASAARHSVTMMIDNTANLGIRSAALATTPFFGTNTSYGGNEVSGFTTGLSVVTVGDDQLMIGFSDKTAPARVVVNGQAQSTTTSGLNALGFKTKATHYRVDLSKISTPILVEIYTSSSTPDYSYDLYTDITDPDGNVTRITTDKGGSYSAPWGSYKFVYGETFTVSSDKAAIEDGYSLTGLTTNVNENIVGSGATYTFIPFPSIEADKPKFTLNIPSNDYITEYSFTAQINNDEWADYIDRYVRYCPHADGDEAYSDLSFTEWGSCVSTFHEGDTYTLYTTVNPEYATISLDGTYLAADVVNDGSGTVKYAYTFTPTAGGRLSISFDVPEGGGETPQPEETETFKIYLNPDTEGAVQAVVYSSLGVAGAPVVLTANVNNEIECGQEGKIEVTVTDPSIYAFGSFVNVSHNNDDYLQNNPPSTETVTIRKSRKSEMSGLGSSTTVEHNGHVFNIAIVDNSTLDWYSLNVNITDDPTNVKVVVGPNNDERSGANREVTGLVKGPNTVRFNQNDRYLFVTGENSSLYSVTSATLAIDTQEPYGYPLVYRYPITAASADATIDITANRPRDDVYSFTLDVDHPECISRLTRYEDASDMLGTNIDLSDITDGVKTITFADGETFRLYIGDRQPETCTFDGSALELEFGIFYSFTPVDGKTLMVRFGEEQVVERPTFTVITDNYAKVDKITNWDTDEDWYITKQTTVIPYTADTDPIRVYLVDNDVKTISFNDEELTVGDVFTQFNPTPNGVLRIFFQREVEVSNDDIMVVCVAEPSNSAQAGIEESGVLVGSKSGREIALHSGRNVVKFNSAVDGAFHYSFSDMPANMRTYHDDAEVEAEAGRYVIDAKHGSIVRTYFEDEAPAQAEVTIEIAPSVQAADEIPVIIKREDIQELNPESSYMEHVGTRYYVYVKMGVWIDVAIEEQGSEPAPAPGKAPMAKADSDEDAPLTPEGYVYINNYEIRANSTLKIGEYTLTGVENLNCSELGGAVYDLNGRIVKSEAARADLNALPAGVYIFNGRKVLVK